mmetsp:Transcript_131030/g.407510  ORF Transcript_131030/g.407510 Transcript_131030/m.407510 type:complete len:217 (-) Transcript_131030:386-1036(-)
MATGSAPRAAASVASTATPGFPRTFRTSGSPWATAAPTSAGALSRPPTAPRATGACGSTIVSTSSREGSARMALGRRWSPRGRGTACTPTVNPRSSSSTTSWASASWTAAIGSAETGRTSARTAPRGSTAGSSPAWGTASSQWITASSTTSIRRARPTATIQAASTFWRTAAVSSSACPSGEAAATPQPTCAGWRSSRTPSASPARARSTASRTRR